jgi:hypothetical protein
VGDPTVRGTCVLLLLATLCLASACTTTKVLKPETAGTFDSANARVLVLPVDVEVGSLLFSGITEPRADWSEAARGHVEAALRARIERSKAAVVQAKADLFAPESPHLQILKLNEVVGISILEGKLGQVPLPTLKDRFDFTLGPDVQALGADLDANYALFVYVRDSYASGGRQAAIAGGVAACIGTLGMFCMIPSGGTQVGFASLVDLSTGDVVWFNRLVSSTGDVREAAPAAKAIDTLLKEFPL